MTAKLARPTVLASFLAFHLLSVIAGSVQTDAGNGLLLSQEPASQSEHSRVTNHRVKGLREHYGNPDYFMQYIIQKPPVYA